MEVDPMPTNRRVLTWLCAYPAPVSTNKWTNRARLAFTLTVFVAVIFSILAATKYSIEYWRIDLENALYGTFLIGAAIWLLYMMITAIILRHRIKGVFESLKSIYKANEEKDLFHILDEANRKSEWIWKKYAIFALGGLLLNNIMLSSASVVYCWMTHGVFDTNQLFTTYKFILPWNQTTKIGYFMEIICDIIFGEVYLLTNGALLLLFISICLYHLAFYNRFKYTISKLGDSKNPENDKKLLCDLVQFHNLVKDWFLETANVYSPLILVELISSVLVLAQMVFQLDLQIKHIDFRLIILLVGVLGIASNLLLYCFFGKLATKSYEDMADCVYDSNWLELQPDLKKYLIVMIADAQQPIYYHGFGLARLRLETFTSLIKTVFSYYMMFKTLTKND